MLRPAIQQRFNSNLKVPNVLNGTVVSNRPTQNLTYREVVFLYTIDIYLNSNKKKKDFLLISSLYSQVDNQTSNITLIPTTIENAFAEAHNKQLAFGLIFIGVMVLLLLPMTIVLRQRFKAH